jgi:hypothetical protein
VNLKKLLIWGAIALVLFFLISAPQEASNLVSNVLNMLKGAATALVTFVRSLFA